MLFRSDCTKTAAPPWLKLNQIHTQPPSSLSHNLSHSHVSRSLTLHDANRRHAKLRSTILLFFLLFVFLSHSFYLPGVAPRDFQSMFPYNPNPLLKIRALFHSFTSHCLLFHLSLSSLCFVWSSIGSALLRLI